MSTPQPVSRRSRLSCGLGIAALAYVCIDYLRKFSPSWHERLQPALWVALSGAAVIRFPFYKFWSLERRAAVPFILSLAFLLTALLFEMVSVRSVTAVLGLDWHKDTPPLPDVGQWLLLALNDHLPQVLVDILRAPIVKLHHFLMLYVMLNFSVLFGSIEAPGLGLGARYMFTMGVGRILRAVAFISTILPSPRPWCASARFQVPAHPHRWAQKYYVPYATDSYAIRNVIYYDTAYAATGESITELKPDWGYMTFLAEFLRPTVSEASSAWYHLLKRASGGCNDLLYSGHILVAVLTAMAWTEAYGGYSSAMIWVLVVHSAQREIRERNHYSADIIIGIYMGILLWKMIGLFWPVKDTSRVQRLKKLEEIQNKLVQAAKDSDIDKVRGLLEEVESSSQVSKTAENKSIWLFAGLTIFFTITMVLLAFILLSDG